nr:hypothetical protein JVH1_8920 [Rhodococcus sp. JVH1]
MLSTASTSDRVATVVGARSESEVGGSAPGAGTPERHSLPDRRSAFGPDLRDSADR